MLAGPRSSSWMLAGPRSSSIEHPPIDSATCTALLRPAQPMLDPALVNWRRLSPGARPRASPGWPPPAPLRPAAEQTPSFPCTGTWPAVTKGDQAVPETCPEAPGPSARAGGPAFCKGDAGRMEAALGRGPSGEDAAPLTRERGHSLSRTRRAARTTRAGVRSRTERRPHGTQITGDIPPSMPVGGGCGGIRRPARPMGGEGAGQEDLGRMARGLVLLGQGPAWCWLCGWNASSAKLSS